MSLCRISQSHLTALLAASRKAGPFFPAAFFPRSPALETLILRGSSMLRVLFRVRIHGVILSVLPGPGRHLGLADSFDSTFSRRRFFPGRLRRRSTRLF